jgi:hypothetical protein
VGRGGTKKDPNEDTLMKEEIIVEEKRGLQRANKRRKKTDN